MKALFLILIGILLATMFFCCCLLRKRDNILKRTVFALNFTGIFIALSYILSIFHFPYKLALFFSGIYYASVHWILVFLVDFTFAITDRSVKSPFLRIFHRVWGVFLIADSVSLLLNVFFEHAFSLSAESGVVCWSAVYHPFFYAHLVFSYILVAIVIAELTVATIKTNRFYRFKYLVLLVSFAAIIFINCFFVFSDSKLDYSILTYAFFSVYSTYYTFYSMPRKIEISIQKLISDNINSGIICCDSTKKIIYANKTAKETFPDLNFFADGISDFFSGNNDTLTKRINVQKKGRHSTFSVQFQNIRDSRNEKIGAFISFSDITDELRQISDELYRSTHDILTGLFNRETFFKKAEELIQKDPLTPRYMIATNIKNFKLLNDLYGSNFGDEILKLQARLLGTLQKNDTLIGRISGDKFAILIQKANFDPAKSASYTEKIESFMATVNYKLNALLGIYEISDTNEKPSLMFDKANLAIKGINERYSLSVAYYNLELLEKIRTENAIVRSFEKTLADGRFKIYLQPQVRCSDEKLTGAEALVRWITPEGEILYPTSFIDVLERAGFLYKLDKYIWTEAAKTLSEWKERGIDYHIAVNISPRDFYYLDIFTFFTDLVKAYDIDPSKLKLEVTETIFLEKSNFHAEILRKLKNAGFCIEMDDFGSGYSSLKMLRNIDIDVLKIDMEFVQKTENKERSEIILSSIVQMAKELDITIIVEGIEDEQQAEYLKSIGCDLFQGFLYSKPVPLSTFCETYCGEKI